MTRIGIIIGSTRPGRNGEQVATWVQELAAQHAGDRASFEVLDLKEFDLPLLDEPVPALVLPGNQPHTVRWAERAGSCDGYIFVTPEYNCGAPASLQNAIDYLYQEWTRKAVAYVGYGSFGAVMAVQELRAQAGRLQMADIGPQLALSLREDFVDHTQFKPRELQVEELHRLVDELLAWSTALEPLRAAARFAA
ncbi:NAD(P)H-dependent oxidoreductase [Streptomyces kaniharaensis]|uniref:NAD(P)H-dependent oxidoreductase n=1 Tax=Streptomyces kaniharaensis TaxID=212423 RepID=A0A6N7L0N7_9ACTN|nr:NAD(P)H-dependent oxidoreductase [Streptomyces kaniharaensis]MQS15734.1 NAD(P)H-dependent oxidoreductase [Streptomyces kaniharaensis]